MDDGQYADRVFINCPFDKAYSPTLDLVTFCIIACGFSPISAKGELDSGEPRFIKLMRLIKSCRYGIHDISRIELGKQRLPRFNMPLEPGLDLGCRYSGSRKFAAKKTLILDREQYRYRKFISDLSGLDIAEHRNAPDKAMVNVSINGDGADFWLRPH